MPAIKKTIYSGEEKEKIEKIFEEMLTEVNYVGEDGCMVCRAATEEEALAKFIKQVKEDTGHDEDTEGMTIENIGIGFLFLVDPENEKHQHMINESEWYVHWSGKEFSDYEVFVYSY